MEAVEDLGRTELCVERAVGVVDVRVHRVARVMRGDGDVVFHG